MKNVYLEKLEACNDIEELKKAYRKLMLANHPDKGGDIEKSQLINEAYEIVFARLQKNTNDKDLKAEAPEEFINLIDNIIKFEEVEIEVVGKWVWLSGNTYQYKEDIKKMNFKYSRKHKKWYYFKGIEKANKKMGSDKSYKQIKDIYGSVKIENEQLRLKA